MISVPPSAGPALGATLDTAGGAWYVMLCDAATNCCALSVSSSVKTSGPATSHALETATRDAQVGQGWRAAREWCVLYCRCELEWAGGTGWWVLYCPCELFYPCKLNC